ncbi:unnamed protein product [Meganyctiphanes norvegica]|uniref:Tetraspanin n=1 Tax=Meganyctiphanes norvegica TaxID=48144 RepID=A0AAV2QEX9_MEGNR
MALDTGMKCIKYLLFMFNMVFVICGMALIIVGAVIEAFYRSYLDFLSPDYMSAPSILITVGCLIFVVGFFGCCGAIKESHCMVVTFAVLLCMIFTVQLAGGITSYVFRTDVEGFLNTNMKKTMMQFNMTNKGIYRTWRVIQHDHKCCGTDNYRDWEATIYGDMVNGVPDDCCKEITIDCGHNIFDANPEEVEQKIYIDGCFESLRYNLVDKALVLGGVAIGIAFVELIGVAFACCLAKSLKHQYQTV